MMTITYDKGDLIDSRDRQANNNPAESPHPKVCAESCYETPK